MEQKKEEKKPEEQKLQFDVQDAPEPDEKKEEKPVKKAEKDWKAEYDKTSKEAAEWKDKYYRTMADTANLRKRLENEAIQSRKYEIQQFALAVLPALDSLDRALEQPTTDEPLRKGVEMTRKQLYSALQAQGVTEIEAENKPFDSNYHHAILSEKKEGVEPGMVIEVLQKGYMLKDRLLRAALVKVSE